jgi:hypothetical protein
MDSPPHPHSELLREFLASTHAHCPWCEFDCFELDSDICPECGRELRVSLGERRLRLGWFVVAIIPCAFSFVATVILTLPLLVALWIGQSFEAGMFGLYGVGILSTVLGTFLIRFAHQFVTSPRRVQTVTAVAVWVAHASAAVGVALFNLL